MKTVLTAALIAASLAACATRSDNISASYISPVTYQGYSCRELAQEAARVSGRAAQAVGAHDQKATNDAVATGVGVVLFWPALFFIKGDGASAAEVASLKGQMEAIEQASIRRSAGSSSAAPDRGSPRTPSDGPRQSDVPIVLTFGADRQP